MPTQIVGDKALQRKLKRLSDLSFLRPVVLSGAVHIAGKLASYPPETAANRPNEHGRWYERGWGTRWRRPDGSIGGKQTSEDLGPSWVATSDSATRAHAGNDASYAREVQGDEQRPAMARIGWKTTSQVVKEEEVKVLTAIQKAVDRELAK